MGSGLEEFLEFDNAEPKDVLQKSKKRFEYLSFADHKWREKKLEWENFYDGFQWTGQEIRELENRSQPTVVINRIKPALDGLVGIMTQTETRIKSFPRDLRKDMAVADAMAEAIRYVEQSNDTKFISQKVLKRGLVTGRGWFNIYVEEDITGRKDIRIRHIDPNDIVFDRASSHYDLSDAEDLVHFSWMTEADIRAAYPKKSRKITKAMAELEHDPFCGWNHIKTYTGDDYAEKLKEKGAAEQAKTWFDKKRSRARVATHWYREREERIVLSAPEIGYYVLAKGTSDEEAADIIRELETQYGISPQMNTRNIRIAKFRTILGSTILDEGETPLQNDKFPYIPFFGYREESTGDHYGIVKSMMDPQREVNKRRSKALHILNSNKIIMDEGAVEDEEELRREAARPDGIIRKNPNKQLEFQNETSIGNFQLEFYNIASNEIDQSSGLNKELLGQYSNIRAASALDIKRQQGLTILSELMMNWKKTRTMLAEAIVDYIQEFWTPESAIRILDDEQKVSFIKFNKQASTSKDKFVDFNEFATEKFDLIFDEAAESSNLADETFGELAKLAQTGMVPPELVIELSPLPFETKQRLLGQIEKSRQAQQEAALQQAAVEAGQSSGVSGTANASAQEVSAESGQAPVIG